MPYTQFTIILHERFEDFVHFDTPEGETDVEGSKCA